MKHHLACTCVLLCVVALLSACGPREKSMQQAAETADRFVAAWHCEARSASEAYSVLEAGLATATDPHDFIAAFLQNVESRGNDTATLAAQVLVLPPRRLAQVVAQPIVRGLSAGTLDRQQARGRIALIVQVGALLKTPHQIRAVSDGLQQAVDHLDLRAQMKVYAASSTPARLGEALRNDRNAPDADLGLIDKQVEALRSIYNDGQMAEFLKTYNQAN